MNDSMETSPFANGANHTPDKLRLTQTVKKGGCAAKIAAHELRSLLKGVRFPPRGTDVLVDGSNFDDAAVIHVNDQLALVQTLDFFTPIVDSPRLFGQIAAANALSDVYAMGGEPRTAMAILAYPIAELPGEAVTSVMQGACDVMSDAGVSLVGGHSIDDDTLKFGLSVTGYIHPSRVWTNAGAQVDDVLILTKPLGTGTLTAALKRSAVSENDIEEALVSMTTLNRVSDLLGELMTSVHAATDVTGFALVGHALQMARASQKSLRFDFHQLPVLARAFACLEQSFLTKAHRTNRDYAGDSLRLSPEIDPTKAQILFDPQTSGGLLLSVKAEFAEQVLNCLRPRFARVSVVGRVEPLSETASTLEIGV